MHFMLIVCHMYCVKLEEMITSGHSSELVRLLLTFGVDRLVFTLLGLCQGGNHRNSDTALLNFLFKSISVERRNDSSNLGTKAFQIVEKTGLNRASEI